MRNISKFSKTGLIYFEQEEEIFFCYYYYYSLRAISLIWFIIPLFYFFLLFMPFALSLSLFQIIAQVLLYFFVGSRVFTHQLHVYKNQKFFLYKILWQEIKLCGNFLFMICFNYYTLFIIYRSRKSFFFFFFYFLSLMSFNSTHTNRII